MTFNNCYLSINNVAIKVNHLCAGNETRLAATRKIFSVREESILDCCYCISEDTTKKLRGLQIQETDTKI